MSGIRFNEDQIAKLASLSIVAKITPKIIKFTQQFKQEALNQFEAGISRREILIKAGIDTTTFTSDYIKDMFRRWSQQDLISEPKSKLRGPKRLAALNPANLTKEQLLARLAYAEAENEFLKKVRALD